MGEQQLKIRIILTHAESADPPTRRLHDVAEDSSPAVKGNKQRLHRGYVLACSAAFVAGLVGVVWLGFAPNDAVVSDSAAIDGDGSQTTARHAQPAGTQTTPLGVSPEAPVKVVAVAVPAESDTPSPPASTLGNTYDPTIPKTDPPAQSTPAADAPEQLAEETVTTVATIASFEVQQDPLSHTARSEGTEELSPETSPSPPEGHSVEPVMASVSASHDGEPTVLATTAETTENVLAPQLSPEDAAALEQSEETTGHVARAQFTTGIRNREPVDRVIGVHPKSHADIDRLYYFTELKALTGRTVTHRWSLDGRAQAEVRFEVRGPNWRVYSSKNLTAAMAGQWQVDVEDSSGQVLDSASFVLEVGG